MMQKQIKEQMISAMKNKDKVRVQTLRGLMTSCVNELVATKRTPQDILEDSEVMTVIARLVKQRKDSISQYEDAGREDLSAEEKVELAILEEYLPAQMTEEEVRAFLESKKADLDLSDKTKIGMVIGTVMKDLKGKVDGTIVKKEIEKLYE
ncbi:MAG: hypothetical protein ACI9AR_000137 [Flavobacteriaceae bacterium]|jgi:uncharacterized protein YqeY